ncbi:MAG: GNAT family protein [Actinomycetota bacterium]|jgi:hypothetical protein
MRLEPFTLTGKHVLLEPLSLAHVPQLCEAAVDRSTFGFTLVPDTPAAMERYVAALVADSERGNAVAFAQRRVADQRLVGCTRFMELRRWSSDAAPSEVEIGGTWLASDAQRTAVNSEAKLLLLTQAFEQWQVQRVAICTDARNERSRAAIERLGAQFEGVLRCHRLAQGDAVNAGTPRDTATYSIVTAEWPGIKSALLATVG